MRVESVEGDRHRVGGETLHLDLAAPAAVEGIGELRAEACDVEMLRAAADFLVRREPEPDGPVRHLGMSHENGGRRHDFGDAGLVVRAEQRRPRRGHDVVAHLIGQCGDVVQPQDRGRVVGQYQVTAVVTAMHDWRDTGAWHFRRRIDVREKPDRRDAGFLRGRGDGGHHVSVFVDRRVSEADGPQLVGQRPQQDQLLVGAGERGRCFVRLGVVANVAEEPVEDVGHSGIM